MKKLKPKRIDWYLLGICLVFVLCWLVPSLIDTNNYMQHPDIRITHDNCHLVKMKEAIEKMGWVSATCRYFLIYCAGCLVFIFLPFSIAARWLLYIRRHLKSWMQLLLLTLVIASAIVIICIDPWYFLYAYLLVWAIDIIFVVVKLIMYIYCRKKYFMKITKKSIGRIVLGFAIACVAVKAAACPDDGSIERDHHTGRVLIIAALVIALASLATSAWKRLGKTVRYLVLSFGVLIAFNLAVVGMLYLSQEATDINESTLLDVAIYGIVLLPVIDIAGMALVLHLWYKHRITHNQQLKNS